jgi:hypothetical protein
LQLPSINSKTAAAISAKKLEDILNILYSVFLKPEIVRILHIFSQDSISNAKKAIKMDLREIGWDGMDWIVLA